MIIKLRKATNFGPLRLKHVFKLKGSVKTIYRVLKRNKLIKDREEEIQKSRNLREVKKEIKTL